MTWPGKFIPSSVRENLMEEGKEMPIQRYKPEQIVTVLKADRGGGSDIELMPQMSLLGEGTSALPLCFFLCGFYLGGVGEWAEAEARRPDMQRFPRERPQGD